MKFDLVKTPLIVSTVHNIHINMKERRGKKSVYVIESNKRPWDMMLAMQYMAGPEPEEMKSHLA